MFRFKFIHVDRAAYLLPSKTNFYIGGTRSYKTVIAFLSNTAVEARGSNPSLMRGR